MTNESWSTAIASGLSRDSIAKIAQHIAKQCAFAPGDDLEPAVAALGGKIEIANLDDIGESSGSIHIRGFRDFDISLAAHTGALRDRFTVAHEIGHYVLHFLIPTQVHGKKLTNVFATRFGNDDAEKEANWFAASFLMPKAEFEEQFALQSGAITDVARFFGVSYRAAEFRSKGLKLV